MLEITYIITKVHPLPTPQNSNNRLNEKHTSDSSSLEGRPAPYFLRLTVLPKFRAFPSFSSFRTEHYAAGRPTKSLPPAPASPLTTPQPSAHSTTTIRV